MTRRWEAEHRGGGRFALRRRRRYGHLAGVAVAAVVGAGAVWGLWVRVDAWLRESGHSAAGRAEALLAGAALLVLCGHAARRRTRRRARRR